MQKILCVGEVLLRLSPPKNWAFDHISSVFIGGAEANVALALSNWGKEVKYLSAIPDNFIGVDIIDFFQKANIDCSSFLYRGERVGTYYMQQGADLKSSSVVYDRNHSSFCELPVNTVDWDSVLKDVSHLHFTAITPALSQNVADLCLEMVKAAKAKEIFISLDLNYRAKLWKYGKEPGEIMPELAQYADLIMGNIWAAQKLINIVMDPIIEEHPDQEYYLDQSRLASEKILDTFPNCQYVANTFRFNAPLQKDGIRYFSTLYNKHSFVFTKQRVFTEILDKAGSGDCFMAGLLYGITEKKSLQDTLNFATAAATGKFYELGDYTGQSVAAIEQKLKNYN